MKEGELLLCHTANLEKATKDLMFQGHTCQDADASPTLPVPYPDGLIVTGRNHPGVLLMELHCTDVVQMAKQREEASSKLVIPHLHVDIQRSESVKLTKCVKRNPHPIPFITGAQGKWGVL